MAGLISGLVDGCSWARAGEAASARASWDQILPAIHRGIIFGHHYPVPGCIPATRDRVADILTADRTLRAS